MGRMDKIFIDPAKLLRRIAVAAASVFLLVYAYFQIAPRALSDVRTEIALAVTTEEAEETDGYLFRHETPVAVRGKSNLLTAVRDGEKVAKGQRIANAYEQEYDTAIQQQIEQIDREINILTKSTVDHEFIVSDINKLDAEIDGLMRDISVSVGGNDFSGASRKRDELLIKMNKRVLTIRSQGGYGDRIAELEAQKKLLNARLSIAASYLYAPAAGYYIAGADGYEKIYLASKLDNMDLDEFQSIISSKRDEDLKNNSAGKIVTHFRWYIACQLDRKAAAKYEPGNTYTIRFPQNANKELKMRLDRLIRETDRNEAVLIFTSAEWPEGFPVTRKQGIEIITARHTGLKVPKSAMRMVDGIKGVYVLVGDIVSFRRAHEVYELDGSYLIGMSESADAFFEGETDQARVDSFPRLALYDHVVVRGRELYDGKIIR